MYFLLHSTARYYLGALCILFWLKSRIIKGVSRYLAFKVIVQLLIASVSPIYLVDEFQFLFLLLAPLTPKQQQSRWHNLVIFECLQMIKQMVVCFYLNLMLECWVEILGAISQFKGSERSP